MQPNADGGWRKSSRCGANGGCFEVAPVIRRHRVVYVGIRDSTDPFGPFIVVGRDQWSAFITKIKTS